MNNPIQMVLPRDGSYICVVNHEELCQSCGFCERWTHDKNVNVYDFTPEKVF